jgi:hypothetical protein
MSYRAIDTSKIDKKGLVFTSQPGKKPKLAWVAIDKLVVDDAFQREVGDRGRKNIKKIASEFRWTRFEPVVVAPASNGRYSVINGQHRATGAKLRGELEIPCAIVDADQVEQAAAFAAINGDVTAMTSLQLFHASLISKSPQSKALQAVCDQAKVKVCRYPVPANAMKKGETLAIGALQACLKAFGDVVLLFALQCITSTGGGNAGLVRGQIVRALCLAVKENPAVLRHRTKIIAAVEEYQIAELWDEARKLSISEKRSIVDLLTQAFREIFAQKVGKVRAA